MVSLRAQVIPGISLVWLGAAVILVPTIPYAFLRPRTAGFETERRAQEAQLGIES